MLRGDVLQLAGDGSVLRRHVDDVAAALRPRRGGGAVIGVRRGFALEDPDGSVTHLPELWSPDGTRAYYVDTPTREISVFDYDSVGGLHDRRTFAMVDAMPDGLTVDAD